MADDETEDMRGEVVAFWRRVYRKVDGMARSAITSEFGQAWRGGKVQGPFVTRARAATETLPAGVHSHLGAVYPDGTTILIDSATGEISAAASGTDEQVGRATVAMGSGDDSDTAGVTYPTPYASDKTTIVLVTSRMEDLVAGVVDGSESNTGFTAWMARRDHAAGTPAETGLLNWEAHPVDGPGNSMTGNALESGSVPISLSSDYSNPFSTALRGWFHVPGTVPGSAQDLGTLDASAGGTTRKVNVYVDTSGHLLGNFTYGDALASPVQTLDLYGRRALPAGWYYLNFATSIECHDFVASVPQHAHGYRSRVWAHDGSCWASWIVAASLTATTHATYTGGSLGVGQNGHSHWPDSTGWNTTDVEVTHETAAHPTVPTVPTAHPSPTGDVLYTMVQTQGVATTIRDTSGNSRDATAGTAHIVADSPYPYVPTAAPMISTIAGNGTAPPGTPADNVSATSFGLDTPTCCCYDSVGNLYFTSGTGTLLYKVPHGTTTAYLLSSVLSAATSLCVDGSDNLYICDLGAAVVYSVPADASIPPTRPVTLTTVAGTAPGANAGDGAAATAAVLDTPNAVAFHGGVLYIGCQGELRKVSGGTITAFAGTGTVGNPTGLGGAATSCPVRNVNSIAFDGSGNCFFSDYGGSTIYRVDHATGFITNFAGIYLDGGQYNGSWDGVDMASGDHNYYVSGPPTGSGIGSGNYVVHEPSIALSGSVLYYYDGNRLLRKMLLSGSTAFVTTIAGYVDPNGNGEGFSGDGGPAYLAQIGNAMAAVGQPSTIAIDPTTGNLALADMQNNRIRLITHP